MGRFALMILAIILATSPVSAKCLMSYCKNQAATSTPTRSYIVIARIIQQQLRRCWRLDPGTHSAEHIVVEIRIVLNPDGSVQQAEIVDAARMVQDAILYLQQTPPIPNLVMGIFIKVFDWPMGVAWACIVLQNAITISTAVLLFRALCVLTRPSYAWCAVAITFLLSVDTIILEYTWQAIYGADLYDRSRSVTIDRGRP